MPLPIVWRVPPGGGSPCHSQRTMQMTATAAPAMANVVAFTVSAKKKSAVPAPASSGSQLGPGSRLIHQELRARVRAALDDLAPNDREILVLRFLEQQNISETAAALGLTESAVKSRQFRAVQRLSKLLSDLSAEREP